MQTAIMVELTVMKICKVSRVVSNLTDENSRKKRSKKLSSGSDFAGWSRKTTEKDWVGNGSQADESGSTAEIFCFSFDLYWCIWSPAPQTQRDKQTEEEWEMQSLIY